MSQPTVSHALKEVTNALSSPELVRSYVRFLTSAAELARQSQEFFGTARFPKVVGEIDGTHIEFEVQTENEEQFINRYWYNTV